MFSGDYLHNRQKDYILMEGAPIPFLIQLGLMNHNGKVYPAKRDNSANQQIPRDD